MKHVEFKSVPGGGFRCSNCQYHAAEKVPHYCPSCAEIVDNPGDSQNWPGNHYPGVDEFGGSD